MYSITHVMTGDKFHTYIKINRLIKQRENSIRKATRLLNNSINELDWSLIQYNVFLMHDVKSPLLFEYSRHNFLPKGLKI